MTTHTLARGVIVRFRSNRRYYRSLSNGSMDRVCIDAGSIGLIVSTQPDTSGRDTCIRILVSGTTIEMLKHGELEPYTFEHGHA